MSNEDRLDKLKSLIWKSLSRHPQWCEDDKIRISSQNMTLFTSVSCTVKVELKRVISTFLGKIPLTRSAPSVTLELSDWEKKGTVKRAIHALYRMSNQEDEKDTRHLNSLAQVDQKLDL